MAGGIDWFRWHHGTVTDQKFPLVARRAGATVAEVIAVWACLLERASMNEAERGWLGDAVDFEAMDCALGLADGRAQAIFEALQQRGLVDGSLQVSAWPTRQPKRERQDDNSTERSRAFRARQRQATPESSDATPSNATPRAETPREEKSREEKNSSSLRSEEGGAAPKPPARRKAAAPVALPDWIDAQAWAGYEAMRKSIRKPMTDDARRLAVSKLADLKDEGNDPADVLRQSTFRSWVGLFAVKADQQQRATSGATLNRQEALEARNRAVGDEWAREMEARDAGN